MQQKKKVLKLSEIRKSGEKVKSFYDPLRGTNDSAEHATSQSVSFLYNPEEISTPLSTPQALKPRPTPNDQASQGHATAQVADATENAGRETDAPQIRQAATNQGPQLADAPLSSEGRPQLVLASGSPASDQAGVRPPGGDSPQGSSGNNGNSKSVGAVGSQDTVEVVELRPEDV